MAAIPHVTRLTKSIIRILGCNPGPMTLQGTNTYLLGTGRKRILVDTGDTGVSQYINNLKDVLEREKAKVKYVILTHWHHDHVGGVKDVLANCSEEDCRVYKFPRTDAPDICPEVPSNIEIKPIQNEQVFNVDGAKVTAIHTPGHTTDHIILKSDDGIVFSGDCILGEGTAVFECLFSYMQSLNKILSMDPRVIYPGHGNIIEDPKTRIEYYIAHRNQREQQIYDFYQERPNDLLGPMDVVKEVYKDVPETLWPAAAYNVSHHLDKLEKECKLQKISVDPEKILYGLSNRSSL